MTWVMKLVFYRSISRSMRKENKEKENHTLCPIIQSEIFLILRAGVPKLFQCTDHVKYLGATLVLREAQNVDVYRDSRTA